LRDAIFTVHPSAGHVGPSPSVEGRRRCLRNLEATEKVASYRLSGLYFFLVEAMGLGPMSLLTARYISRVGGGHPFQGLHRPLPGLSVQMGSRRTPEILPGETGRATVEQR
jgi:hypothetical protein